MDDTISRQAAIDAVCMEWCGVKHQDCKHPFDVEKDDCYWCDGCETALQTLPELPSAQPEKACIAKITLSEEQVREAFEKAKSEIVQVLPSAQPEQRWIPMKERRPEKDGRYLCTFQGKAVHICMYLNGCFRLYGYNEDNLITAWMPLPEPYREEERDD